MAKSKVQQAKEAQGYNPKPIQPMCSNCQHLVSIWKNPNQKWDFKREYIQCGIGGFTVKKQGTCNSHQFKDEI